MSSYFSGLAAVAAVAAVAASQVAIATPATANCGFASTNIEQAICSDEQLRDEDKELGRVYRQLLHRHAAEAQALRVEQRQWLRQRGQCGPDKNCLTTVYSARVEQLRSRLAYAPDSTDWQAAIDLREEVLRQAKRFPDWALESALEQRKVRHPVTRFTNVEPDGGSSEGAAFPAVQSVGVLDEEWRALRKAAFTPEGENGMGSYMLADLDGDGERDLVVDTYVGGTGLFDSVSVYRRVGSRFAGFGRSPDSDDDHFMYTTNGRGANQYGAWVELRGRTYLVYVDGVYGRDHVILLRPFELNQRAIGWDVQYAYDWTLPRMQAREGQAPVELPAPTWAGAVRGNEARCRFHRSAGFGRSGLPSATGFETRGG